MLHGVGAVGLVFFQCEVGQRFTNPMDGINDNINQIDWYLFPIGIQRILPLIMMNTQKPNDIECFSIVSVSREQFKKVKLNEFHPIILL